MLSALKLPSTKVKVEEDEVEEEEAEGLQLQKIEPVTIKNTQIIHITLTTFKVRGGEERDGTISPIFTVTNPRSMDTMNKNAKRSKLTRIVTRIITYPMSLKNKKAHQR